MCDVWFHRSGVCGFRELVSVSLFKSQLLPDFWSWGSSLRWDLIQVLFIFLFFYFFLEAVFFHLFWHCSVSALLTFSWLSEVVCQHLADDPGPFVAFLNILMNVSAIRGLFFLIQFLVCRVWNLWDLKWLHTTAANDCAAAHSRLFNSDWWVGYYRQTFVLTLTCYAVCLVIAELEDLLRASFQATEEAKNLQGSFCLNQIHIRNHIKTQEVSLKCHEKEISELA